MVLTHLIFDLDGTLVKEDDNVYNDPVLRPGAEELLTFLFNDLRVGSISIWTAAGKWWMDKVLQQVLLPIVPGDKRFRYTWCSEMTNMRSNTRRMLLEIDDQLERYQVKRLRRMWKHDAKQNYEHHMERSNTVIIDNTPKVYEDTYGNGIPVSTWTGESDSELERLSKFLNENILGIPNVHRIEKRWWRSDPFIIE